MNSLLSLVTLRLLGIHIGVCCLQPHHEMLLRCDDLTLSKRVRVRCIGRRHEVLDPITRNRIQLHRTSRVAEEGNRVPRATRRLALNAARSIRRKHDTVHSTPEQPIRPVREQVSDVDQDRRARVVFGARRRDWHGSPGVIALEDLKAGLALKAEEEGHGAVIRVRSSANIFLAVGGGICCWVAEEAENGAGGAVGGVVGGGEEVADLVKYQRTFMIHTAAREGYVRRGQRQEDGGSCGRGRGRSRQRR